ncbi:MAG: site-specific DNA-methyltransferase [Candidatus Neomarinimicrobiota bacterium]
MFSTRKNPLFSDPIEPVSGLTISDLNRYLPAVHKIEDISMTAESMQTGLFLGLGLQGLQKLPDKSIDLIIADPPETPLVTAMQNKSPMKLQEYYKWNDLWIKESQRILKNTGAIFLMTGWRYSGMYQALLSNYFRVQTRITWRDRTTQGQTGSKTWFNQLSDIWFATKTGDFYYNKKNDNKVAEDSQSIFFTEIESSNLWSDILDIQTGSKPQLEGDKPEQLISRILETSSLKLNWVVDPFMRCGGVGVVAKRLGRRFIGFEALQDRLLMAMKRIDHD